MQHHVNNCSDESFRTRMVESKNRTNTHYHSILYFVKKIRICPQRACQKIFVRENAYAFGAVYCEQNFMFGHRHTLQSMIRISKGMQASI